MLIEYYIEKVYGINRFYVKDKAIAEALETLTGHKSLSKLHIAALQKLGFTFNQVL